MNNWHDFTAVYTQHRNILVGFFKTKRLSHEDAEDLTQQTFLLAARSWPQHMVQDPKPWILKIAVNVWRNYVRNLKAFKRDIPLVALELSPEAPSSRAAPPTLLQTKEWISRVLACVEKLPEPHRRVLCLRGPGNCSVEEVATLLQIEEGTVKSRTHSARKLLKACLDSTAQVKTQGANMEAWENYLNEALTALACQHVPSDSHHLDEVSLVSFLLDEMEPETRELALGHLVYCPKCLAFLRALREIDQSQRLTPSIPRRDHQNRYFGLFGLAAGLLLGILGSFMFQRQGKPLQNPIRVELDSITKRGNIKIKVPIDKDALDLQVHLEATHNYPRYRLELHYKKQLFQSFDKVMPDSGTVSIILNPRDLPRGIVMVRVFGVSHDQAHLLAEHQFELTDLP